MIARIHPKLMPVAACVFTAVLLVACLVMPRGLALMGVSDIVLGALMFLALLAFASKGVASKGRMRWFFMLQAAGWALWFGDQICWITFDLILKKKFPQMYPAGRAFVSRGRPDDCRTSIASAHSPVGAERAPRNFGFSAADPVVAISLRRFRRLLAIRLSEP